MHDSGGSMRGSAAIHVKMMEFSDRLVRESKTDNVRIELVVTSERHQRHQPKESRKSAERKATGVPPWAHAPPCKETNSKGQKKKVSHAEAVERVSWWNAPFPTPNRYLCILLLLKISHCRV